MQPPVNVNVYRVKSKGWRSQAKALYTLERVAAQSRRGGGPCLSCSNRRDTRHRRTTLPHATSSSTFVSPVFIAVHII